jgi:hypothetical protein
MIKLHKYHIKKKLKFSYKPKNTPVYLYLSNTETGNVVLKSTLNEAENHEINLEHFPNGLYNLIIVDGQELLKEMFIK